LIRTMRQVSAHYTIIVIASPIANLSGHRPFAGTACGRENWRTWTLQVYAQHPVRVPLSTLILRRRLVMHMRLSSEVDVAIIGAGAAGLAAYSALAGHRLSVIILESRDRIGGRAQTRYLPGGIVFDVGCEWLHSADQNAFVPIAETLNFDVAVGPPHWGEQSYNINFSLTEQREFHAASEAFYERLEAASELPADTAAAAWLESGNRWNALIDAVSSYVNGSELAAISVHDVANYLETGLNWRVRTGYGALICSYGATCEVALRTRVSAIDHTGRRIKVETSRGTLLAHRVIYTLPTPLMAEQAVRFTPTLPAKISAAAGLPLGHAEKVMLAIDEAELFPEDGHLFGSIDRTATGSYDLRPLGQPCIEAFFGGSLARELELSGELTAFAVDELVALLGAGFRTKVHPCAASSWARDIDARGSYSYALPGHANDRAVLAAPVDGRLFFAGEATSAQFFSTAHGAYETGIRAAGEVAASMGLSRDQVASPRPSAGEPDHLTEVREVEARGDAEGPALAPE
jgi:monoamine oxidase